MTTWSRSGLTPGSVICGLYIVLRNRTSIDRMQDNILSLQTLKSEVTNIARHNP